MAKTTKKSTAASWKILALFLALVLVAGTVTGIVFWQKGNIEFHPIENEQITDDEDDGEEDPPATEDGQEENEDGATIASVSENGIKLRSAAIATADFAANDISPLAETAYTLTATVEPSTASNKNVTWSVAWKNASSTWAKGKSVSSYIKLSSTSGASITVSCLGAFGEQAIVTCTSQDNPEVSATCTVDYRERVSSAELVIRANNNDYTINETPAIPLADSATASMNVVKTVGTIESEFETTVSVSFTDEYVELLESTYGDSWGTGFSGKYTLSMGAQSLSGLFEDLIVPEIHGAYFDSEYVMMLYAEIIDWTNSQSVAVLSFTITVKNTSTSETSTYVYDCPLADIVVPVGDVTLNEDGIIF